MSKPEFSMQTLADALSQINEHVTRPEEMLAFYERHGIDREMLYSIAEEAADKKSKSAFVMGFMVAWVIATKNP
jgi:hypothetical protein